LKVSRRRKNKVMKFSSVNLNSPQPQKMGHSSSSILGEEKKKPPREEGKIGWEERLHMKEEDVAI